jgi:cytoskeleton protein RodZ
MALQAQHLLEARNAGPEDPPAYKPDVPEMPLDKMEPWDAFRSGRNSGSSWITAAALFVAAMVVCSAVYWWWERPHQPVVNHVVMSGTQETVEPPVSQPAISQPNSAAQTGATTPPDASQMSKPLGEPTSQTAAAPVTSALDAGFRVAGIARTAVAPPAAATTPASENNPNASVRVEITAVDAVWVRARVNGKYSFSATLQPHQTRTVDADGAVELLLGNAGGASISLNGKPLSLEGFPAGTVGPKGQVRVVQLTSGGFQIVPSKPPDERDR